MQTFLNKNLITNITFITAILFTIFIVKIYGHLLLNPFIDIIIILINYINDSSSLPTVLQISSKIVEYLIPKLHTEMSTYSASFFISQLTFNNIILYDYNFYSLFFNNNSNSTSSILMLTASGIGSVSSLSLNLKFCVPDCTSVILFSNSHPACLALSSISTMEGWVFVNTFNDLSKSMGDYNFLLIQLSISLLILVVGILGISSIFKFNTPLTAVDIASAALVEANAAETAGLLIN